MLRVDTDIEACGDMTELRKVILDEFKLKNPRLVARHKWLKIKQKADESFTDFIAREKNPKKIIGYS